MDDDKSREGTGEFGMGEGAVSADVSVAVAECVDSLPASDAEGEGEGEEDNRCAITNTVRPFIKASMPF